MVQFDLRLASYAFLSPMQATRVVPNPVRVPPKRLALEARAAGTEGHPDLSVPCAAALAAPGSGEGIAAAHWLRIMANAAADGQFDLLQNCAALGAANSVVKLLVAAKDTDGFTDSLSVRLSFISFL